MVNLVEADPRWEQAFEVLSESLGRALGDLALRIDHIGSTAVPVLVAKDVVDVQVIVRSLEPRQAVICAFERAGFQQSPGSWNLRDHIPPGFDGDPQAWDKMTFAPVESPPRSNVHVRVSSQPNERYALLFRDFLRG